MSKDDELKRKRKDRRKQPMFKLDFNSLVQVALLGVMSWIAYNVQMIKTDNALLNQSFGYMQLDNDKHRLADNARFAELEKELKNFIKKFSKK